MRPCVVGIDASRNRSGGAKHHLVGLLKAGDPAQFGIGQVHVWAYRSLLEVLPSAPWLVKHNPPALERSLPRQLWWQRFALPAEMRRHRCDVLLSTDAGTIGVFEPSVAMSRDMLSYEPGEMSRYGLSKAWLRLILLRYIQVRSLKRARGAIFLTQYAAEIIQKFTGQLANAIVIPHGVGDDFRQTGMSRSWPGTESGEIRCLYVSNTELYKHQWMVVRAIEELRQRGHNVSLTLAGGGMGEAQRLLDREIGRADPHGRFVRVIGAVRHEEIPQLLTQADVFIFASSCENMPNTLVEGMASGLPIACSDRGPMPEVLGDGGVYFDPENAGSIAGAVESLILNPELRLSIARRAKERAANFSWARCARETWTFLRANVPNVQASLDVRSEDSE
jgi:glycosyltransferase involved in cell wall biosynthesis